MNLASIVDQYHEVFMTAYGTRLLPSQRRALDAIRRCRTAAAGELRVRCDGCDQLQRRFLSCGHRHCPRCQNHEASQWLERQQAKLLPVTYFMVTFTLPRELRTVAWQHQRKVYSMLFDCAVSTLKTFGLNPKGLGADLGMTAILHTHNRRLDFHPHVHIIVPGGGIDKLRRQWKKTKGPYLFNAFALAKVFRARMLDALNAANLIIPGDMPKQWVVDCRQVGSGKPALQYLSRYLYRGVISERHIIKNENGQVTFEYVESKSGRTHTRTLKGEDFLWLVLQHTLPRGFRRARDYGFLHSNARQTLKLVQWVLKVIIEATAPRPRSAFQCPRCQSPMHIEAILRPNWPSG